MEKFYPPLVQGARSLLLVQDLQDFLWYPVTTGGTFSEIWIIYFFHTTFFINHKPPITDDCVVVNYTHFLRGPLILLADPLALVVLGLPEGERK